MAICNDVLIQTLTERQDDMVRRFVACIVLSILCTILLFSAESTSPGGRKKSLPLNDVPNFQPKTRENSTYLPDRIILKLMPGVQMSVSPAATGVASVDAALASLSVSHVEPMFPEKLARKEIGNVGLDRFIVVKYSSPVDAFTATEQLSNLPEVQYAEPWFIYSVNSNPTFTPNDPQYSLQYGLTRMRVNDAWDITQGDTSVVIGIVDSGVETGHSDLSANIWMNPGESGTDGLGRDKRTNGVDDDGNGYVDDWQGWDFGGGDYNNVVPDNNPNPTGANNNHGTATAGVASASTNNGIGVAGTGFKCRLLPVKTAADNDTRAPGGLGYIIAGYEGIVYAGLMGAKVINCSWGGSGGSQVEQDLINAVTQQGSLVVAAAGNDNSSGAFYPSGYANVLSVASTGTTDVRSSFSNYGGTVDVAAPGENIRTTLYPNTYASEYGTSFSSPFTAGVCALVKSANPSFTPLQLGERVRVTADNINSINPSYADQLGKGRVNAYRALTENPPSVRGSNIVVQDSSGGNNNGNPEPGETIDVYVTFTNYLAPTTNGTVTLTTTSSFLTISTNSYNLGSLGTLATRRNTSNPFRIQIAANVPAGHLATMKMLISDGTYSDYQWFTILINPTFQTHNVNNVVTTMTNNGRIGFNDFPGNLQGDGFKYPADSANHLFEGGVIIGTSATKVVSNIRNAGGTQDADMLSRQIYQLVTPGIVSNQDGSTVYSDSSAPIANQLGIRVNQYSYEFSDPAHDDYIIVRYDIRNLTGSTISGLYIGQFFDWDIANYATNRTGYDATRSLAYAWDANTATAPYIGMRALDSAAGVRGLLNVSLTVDRAAKWTWISGGTSQATVGPGDIHSVISSGPFNIPAGQVQWVAFATIGGANLAAVQSNADAAKAKWDQIRGTLGVDEAGGTAPESYSLEQNYPNPFNPSTIIKFQTPQSGRPTLKVYDLLGREVVTLLNGAVAAGRHEVSFSARNLPSGIYFYTLKSDGFTRTLKMVLMK